MSRLDFAPGTKDMKVTDIRTGHFVFTPKPDKAVSYERLQRAIEGAGYEIETAAMEVVGTLDEEDALRVPASDQRLRLTGDLLAALRQAVGAGSLVSISGAWRSLHGNDTLEVRTWSVPDASPR